MVAGYQGISCISWEIATFKKYLLFVSLIARPHLSHAPLILPHAPLSPLKISALPLSPSPLPIPSPLSLRAMTCPLCYSNCWGKGGGRVKGWGSILGGGPSLIKGNQELILNTVEPFMTRTPKLLWGLFDNQLQTKIVLRMCHFQSVPLLCT